MVKYHFKNLFFDHLSRIQDLLKIIGHLMLQLFMYLVVKKQIDNRISLIYNLF